MNINIHLLLVFFKIGLFSLGGGYVIIPFIEEEVININHWISSKEFVDIIGIATMTPGPISVNMATFVGYKMNGMIGSIVATFALILPSYIICTLLARFISNNEEHPIQRSILYILKPVVVGLILCAAVGLTQTIFFTNVESFDYRLLIIFFISFFMLLMTKIHPILVIVLSGILGLLISFL